MGKLFPEISRQVVTLFGFAPAAKAGSSGIFDVTVSRLKYHSEYSGCPDARSSNTPSLQAGYIAKTAHRLFLKARPYCPAVRLSKNLLYLLISMSLVIPGKTVCFVS